MKELIKHFLKSLIDWIFRRRSPALKVMRYGIIVISIVFGGWLLDISILTQSSSFKFTINTDTGTPTFIIYVITFVGCFLIFFGLGWEVIRQHAEQRRISRKKIIIIEERGLRDSVGMALADALPKKLEGHHHPIIIDLRQGLVDGHIVSPQTAIDKLVSLPIELTRNSINVDRSDLKYIYGGLAPVPLTFLTGILLDDEIKIDIYDWDRHQQKWRSLDELDDKERFTIEGLDEVSSETKEVAVLISTSYEVDKIGVINKLGNIPQVSLKLNNITTDSHWSEKKQEGLGRQYFETVKKLSNIGVKHIHLFLAAPNSIVFRFGRLYDKRNLPELIVYQYQRDCSPPYPWGISMPVSGCKMPSLISKDSTDNYLIT